MTTKYMRKDAEIEAIVWNTANIRAMRLFVGPRAKLRILEDDSLEIVFAHQTLLVPSGYYVFRTMTKHRKYSVLSMDEFDEIYDKMYPLIVKEKC